MTKQDFRDMYQHPPTMMSIGLVGLVFGVLVCLFGAMARMELSWYILWVFPLTGIGWMVFGYIKLGIAQTKMENDIKARKEKERAQEAKSTRHTGSTVDVKG